MARQIALRASMRRDFGSGRSGHAGFAGTRSDPGNCIFRLHLQLLPKRGAEASAARLLPKIQLLPDPEMASKRELAEDCRGTEIQPFAAWPAVLLSPSSACFAD